jgi:hypothetical protein
LKSICADLNESFCVSDKTVVEIGAGDGEFLSTLRKIFNFNGYGFDTSWGITGVPHDYKDLHWITGHFDSNSDIKPDLFILRHVLEHQNDVKSFLGNILLGKPKHLYIEIPCLEWIAKNNIVYAFSYEHCSYFSKTSLEFLLSKNGYLSDKIQYNFDSEYLQFFGSKNCNVEFKLEKSKKLEDSFEQFIQSFQKKLSEISSRILEKPHTSVLWGASGKGTMLLNTLGISYKDIKYVVDSNPKRWQTYIPITAQEVISPDTLKEIQPEYVFITNPLYQGEIQKKLNEYQIKAKVISLV